MEGAVPAMTTHGDFEPERASFRAFSDLTAARSSCRAFLPDRVPQATIGSVLELAQRTPSWCNCQPWQVAILSGAAVARFAEQYYQVATKPQSPDLSFPAGYFGRYKQRRSECGWQLYESIGIGRGDREASARQGKENYRFFGAPHLAMITSDRDLGPYGAIDCGGYITSFTLAAQSLGIATCPQAALATHADFVRSYLGLGPDRIVICGIAFGFADRSHPINSFRTSRAGLEEAVTWLE
jgi:nitroreductase